ncbi:ATP-binding protein [Streptomyces sp. NPDC001930]|uniref:ATP-binding protein n=1 Tax=Streptomyces sp. NPDC001930 TaxID=3364625 RepID=UPI0036BF330B
MGRGSGSGWRNTRIRPISRYPTTPPTPTRDQAAPAAGRQGLPGRVRRQPRRADATTLGYLEFLDLDLDLVLGEEPAVRDERRFRQGLRLSKLPHHKTIDDDDFAFQPELDPRKVNNGPSYRMRNRLGASDADAEVA